MESTLVLLLLLLLSLGKPPLVGLSTGPLTRYSVTIRVLDQSPEARPISNASVTIAKVGATQSTIIQRTAASNGEVVELLEEGTYNISAASPVALYGRAAQSIMNSTVVQVPLSPASVELRLPICDARIEVLSPTGAPLPEVDLTIGGVYIGTTGSDGSATALSIPKGSFNVTASLYGEDISPTAVLVVTRSATFTVTASNTAQLQIRAVGALGQGLPRANVTVGIRATALITTITGEDGALSLELPYGIYYVVVSYKGFEATRAVSLTGDTTEEIRTDVFVELLGMPLTLVSFAFWIAVFLALLLVIRSLFIRLRKK